MPSSNNLATHGLSGKGGFIIPVLYFHCGNVHEMEHTTKNHILTQRFIDQDLESSYWEHWFQSSLIFVRWALFISGLTHIIFLGLDVIVLEDYSRYWYIRGFVLIPVSFAGYIFTYFSWYRSKIQWLNSLLFFINGICMGFGTVMYGEQSVMYWVSGTVLVAIFCCVLLGLRFTYAATITWLITIWQVAAVLHIQASEQNITISLVLMLASAMFLTVGNYVSERTSRRSFLISQQLLVNEQKHHQIEQSRIEWLEQIASFLRHELRNAMIGARTSIELLDRSGEINKAKKYVERGGRSIEIMSSLLDSVSNASSLESSFYKEETHLFSLSELLKEYIEDCHDNNHGREIRFSCTPSNFEINGREERIIQLLDKIIENALDHAHELSAITVKANYQNRTATIEIINEGQPLPQDKEAIFDLFTSFREHDIQGQKRGYGLYVARMIAEQYGGSLKAFDLEGTMGARFVITLPSTDRVEQ